MLCRVRRPDRQLLVALCLGVAQIAAAEAAPPEAALESEPPGVGAPRACVACLVDVAAVRRGYSSDEWAALESGEIRTIDEGRIRTEQGVLAQTRALALIRQPPDRVWRVLTDFETWPGFVPHIRKAEIARRERDRLWVRMGYRVLLSSLQHTTIYQLLPEQGRLLWTLDLEQEHDIAASEGEWQLVPVGDQSQTLVRYAARMDSGRPVPEFVADLLGRRSLKQLLLGLREEVERRYGPARDGARD